MNLASHERNVDKFSTVATVTATVTVTVKQCMTSVGLNLVDITKLHCYPHRRSTTVSLETFTLYS